MESSTNAALSAGPLAGILVADFSRVLAGPLATMTLGDLGARVIKVEKPGAGDDTRSWGPPLSETGSTYFDSVNRNKESVCLDLVDAGDRALAFELASRADVVIENFKPGGMAKLGLAYSDIAAVNPRVVYVSISGFGSAGGADLPGYDFMVQAVGGLMSITGEANGQPTKAGVAVVDILTAKDATIGILAALNARHTSGRGAHLEVNLLSSLHGALANQAQAYLGAGIVPTRMGNALQRALAGHSTVAVGHSGVGKSTLVNVLVPGAHRAIGHVNEVTGRGRHTSSSTVTLKLESPYGSGWVIDTPGVRSFGLGHVNPDNILGSFSDLATLAEKCPRGCTHLPDSPDCAMIEAVEAGALGAAGAGRLDSLQRLLTTFADKGSHTVSRSDPEQRPTDQATL